MCGLVKASLHLARVLLVRKSRYDDNQGGRIVMVGFGFWIVCQHVVVQSSLRSRDAQTVCPAKQLPSEFKDLLELVSDDFTDMDL